MATTMKKAKLIIVDDDPAIRKFIRKFAEGLGFDVGEAGTGIEYREKFGDTHADIIFLDIAMPEEHGLALFDFFHNHHRQTPIVIITGRGEAFIDASIRLGVEKGLNMAGGLSKPIDFDEMERLLKVHDHSPTKKN